MTKRKIIGILLSAVLHILCIFYLMNSTLIYYDCPYFLLTPFLHIIFCLAVCKNKKAVIGVVVTFILLITAWQLISHFNMKQTQVTAFKKDYVNSVCMKIKDFKDNAYSSVGQVSYYNSIMTNECFKYVEKEYGSDNDDECLLQYEYTDFFFEGNADLFYERISSKYIIDENYYRDYGNIKAFVINCDEGWGEFADIKEFSIKNGTEVIHGSFWGDINKEEMLKKIEEFYL